ncbi:MAG TPA: NAD(P)/FAD-dependent oxidoreductase [Roseiflexaceae bacterium]|nr:NAD(P)/FAD-dependent oxidoreductase [Roseiflexaceae bacterium]
MRAIIIGGGIGGPLAAVALQRVGIEATVYEAHDGPAESLGLFLGLGINGMRVLRQLGLLDAVLRTDCIPTPAMVFSSATGKRLGAAPNGWLDPHTPSITLMRGALQSALADEARARGIAICYGKRFRSFTEQDGRVVTLFDDGSTAEGDLLLGADGIRSRVRAAMLPDGPEPSYVGLLNLGGVVQQSDLPATPGEMHMVWGKRAFFGYTVRPGGEAWWFANLGMRQEPRRQELAARSTEEWKGMLCELFAGDAAFISALIRRTETIGATPIHDLPSLPRWSTGRAALLGDAAHAVSPSAGQGASMAMEDALMLAVCLRDTPDPQQALCRYEQLRRPRAERIVASGRARGNYKALRSRAAVFLRDLLMPLAFRLFATERSLAWIYDYEIPLEAPVASPLAV